MSKRQDKIEERRKEQQEFLNARKVQQVAMLEQAYQIGAHLYESNKDKLSPEEIEQIEGMKAEQLATIEKLKNEVNQDA